MQAFARLLKTLDGNLSKESKVSSLIAYFRSVAARDAAWALHFLMGRRIRRLSSRQRLQVWVAEVTGFPDWLIDECSRSVGDAAEAVSLLLPEPCRPRRWSLSELIEGRLLSALEVNRQAELVKGLWLELEGSERLVLHRILLGGNRLGVSSRLLFSALAKLAGVQESVMVGRLSRFGQPSETGFLALLQPESEQDAVARPYPFRRPEAVPIETGTLGEIERWAVEWLWDGVRVQVVRRGDEVMLWSPDGALMNPSFPEVIQAASSLKAGTVLDGMVLDCDFERNEPRMKGRKGAVDRRVFLAFDLLEFDGKDLRSEAWWRRRQLLEELVSGWKKQWLGDLAKESTAIQGDLFAGGLAGEERSVCGANGRLIQISEVLERSTWASVTEHLDRARKHGAAGLVLKQTASVYVGDESLAMWLKWESDPFVIETVLISVRPSKGGASKSLDEYSLAVKQGAEWVTVARISSGLDQGDRNEIDAFVRRHDRGRHGPVRLVEPRLVFCVAFQGITSATRSRAGISLKSPRIVRWSRDKTIDDVGTLESLKTLTGARD